MAFAISDPAVVLNNEPVNLAPGTVVYTEGLGEQSVRAQSSGNGSVDQVYSDDVTTHQSMCKFSIFNVIESIELMLENAKTGIKDWTKRSVVNKTFDKGAAWNMLANPKSINALKNGEMKRASILYKTNLVREFGEFLPEHLKSPCKKKDFPEPIHQKPIFNWEEQ